MLLASALAIVASGMPGAATLIHRRVDAYVGVATWVVPTRLNLVPEAPVGVGPPTRLRIGSLNIDTAIEPLALDSAGVLESPKEYRRAGWFAAGTAPGDAGPAVIAGHVDSRTGPAVFLRLHELRPGAKVEVQRDDKWLGFSVTAVERYPKATFPSQRVYGPTPGPELRLITCGGAFDAAANSYRENVVVYAVLAAPSLR